MRVVRLAFATGAGSFSALDSAVSPRPEGGVTRGRMVDRASGRRRVRKSCDDWRYVLEMCEVDWRAEAVGEDRDDIDEDRSCEWREPNMLLFSGMAMEPVGLRVAV